jgi:hypothetical protein
MHLANPASWLFTLGVSLLMWGAYQAGAGLMAEPVDGAGAALGLGLLAAGAVLTPLGLRVWAHRRS